MDDEKRPLNEELVIVLPMVSGQRSNSDVFGGQDARWMIEQTGNILPGSESTFVESHIGFDATILQVALKDTGCPLSVGELIDLIQDGEAHQWDAGKTNDEPDGMTAWIVKIQSQINND